MTTSDRFERTVANLFASVGRPDASDLIHDVLVETTSVRQRRSWTFPSRWLPATLARRDLFPAVGRRRWIVLAVALLVAALLAVGIGAMFAPPPVPTIQHDGRFVPIPSIPESAPAMVIALNDGRVLLESDPRGDGRAQIWDPATGTIRPAGPMVAPGRLPHAVLLGDGRVLLVGGDYVYTASEGSPSLRPTAEIFDPARGTFTPLGPLPDPLFGQLAVRLDDGRVLVTAGMEAPGDMPVHPLAAAELFDPSSNAFSATGGQTSPRAWADAVKLGDGRVLVVGGQLPDSAGRVTHDDTATPTAEIYDPAAGRFAETASLPPIPADTIGYRWPLGWWGPLVALADGRAMVVGLSCQEVHDVIGGVSPGASPTRTYVYDPRSGSFSAGPTVPHCVQQAFPLPDGLVFMTGWWYTSSIDTTAQNPDESSPDVKHSWSGLLDPRTGAIQVTQPPPGGPYLYLLQRPDGSIVVRSGEDPGAYLYR